MFQLKFQVVIAFTSIFLKFILGQTAAGWDGMNGRTLYAGAYLNRAISTGAGPRSAVSDVRGLPMFGVMGPTLNVNNMPSPRMVKRMLMMRMTGAMALLAGMGLDESMPFGRNGGLVADEGPRMSPGMILDEAKRTPNGGMVLDDGRPMPMNNGMGGMAMAQGRGMGTRASGFDGMNGNTWAGNLEMGAGDMPGTGGMSMGGRLGNNAMPWSGGMPLYGGMGMMSSMGMPLGAAGGGNQPAADGVETTTVAADGEVPVAASSTTGGETPPGDSTPPPKDV